MLNIQQVNLIDSFDWDKLVKTTYGRPYCFQQQDGCKDRGTYSFTVPSNLGFDYQNDSVPEFVNHSEMGVSFNAWLSRDPKQKIKGGFTDMWWERNFYPMIESVADDLHNKGLLPAGNYLINIDW